MYNTLRTALRVLALAGVLLLFFVSLELMGSAFKLMGKGFAEALLATTANPFVGLFIGILATSLVQSSSTTTVLTVGLVASGALTIEGAVPIIMGANIGTTVTNTIVSLGHITRPEEFRRAVAGATVHDFFNLMAVAVLFPLEVLFGIISGPAELLTAGLVGIGGASLLSPLKAVTKPISKFVISTVQENGIVVLVVGTIFLFVSLRYLVVLLKSLVLGRAESFLHKYIFGTPIAAMLCGLVLTVMVQSSSVTTSIAVPLVGAGILTVRQIFPYTLGANVGTTITALLAALAATAGVVVGDEAAMIAATASLTVAFSHLLFNLFGIGLIYGIKPLREIPIRLAEHMGTLTLKNRGISIAYIVVLFFVIPLILVFIT